MIKAEGISGSEPSLKAVAHTTARSKLQAIVAARRSIIMNNVGCRAC